MFWSLSIITVREKHHEPIFNIPFRLARRDKLVDHDLSAVCKVTKLSFPQDEAHWVGNGVAVFKTKDGVLTEV